MTACRSDCRMTLPTVAREPDRRQRDPGHGGRPGQGEHQQPDREQADREHVRTVLAGRVAQPGGDRAAEQRPGRGRGQQHAEPDAAQAQPVLGDQHEHGLDGGEGEVDGGGHGGQPAQQPMLGQPPQPGGDVRAQRGPRAGPPDGEPAPDPGHQQRAAEERHRVGQVRQPGCEREQQAAGGRTEELLAHRLRPQQPAVGRRESVPVPADDRRDGRLRRAVEERLPDAEQERTGRQQRDARPAGQERGGDRGQDRRPGQVDAPHQPPPVQPVDQGATDQADQQPGKRPGRPDQTDEQRVPGEGGGEQGTGGEGDAVAEGGDGRGRPQPAEVGPEARPSPALHADPPAAGSPAAGCPGVGCPGWSVAK